VTVHKDNVLSFGVNINGDVNHTEPGTHAEHNALLKLKPLKNKKKLVLINLLVVRLSRTNKIQNSKPCNNCIQKMKYIPAQKGYKLQNIYYSGNDENIIKTTIAKLEQEEQHFSKFYRTQLDSRL